MHRLRATIESVFVAYEHGVHVGPCILAWSWLKLTIAHCGEKPLAAACTYCHVPCFLVELVCANTSLHICMLTQTFLYMTLTSRPMCAHAHIRGQLFTVSWSGCARFWKSLSTFHMMSQLIAPKLRLHRWSAAPWVCTQKPQHIQRWYSHAY